MSSTYGEALREQRKVLRVTIVELAKKMGVSQSYISRIELGMIAPVQEQKEVILSFLEDEVF